MLFLVFIIYVILAFLLLISSLLVVISLEIRKIRAMTTCTTDETASEPGLEYEILPETLQVPGYYTPAPALPALPAPHAVFSTPAPRA